MLTDLQTAVITMLAAKITNGYPAAVQPYTGAMRSPKELKKQIKNTPVVQVGVRSGSIKSDEVLGRSAHINSFTINVYGFESNKAGRKENVNSGLELAEWMIDALQGETVTANNRTFALSKSLEVTIEDDSDPFIIIIDSEVKA
mgnify:CR=1 FL=1